MGSSLPDREGKAEYRAPRLQLSLHDFQLERRLGEGSYAQVVQVMQKDTGQHYALKVVDKHLVLKNKYTEYIKTERKLLDRLDSPWIVNLHFTFQDTNSLYFVLELCPNGELHDQLQRRGKLPLDDATFYAAEIVLILEYLRDQKIIHRDLKPENLMLDEQGHLKLIDFGSAKDLGAGSAPVQQPPQRRNSLQQSQRSASMVGTAEYLAPEVLRNEATGFAADLWALGCLLYRMLLGTTPFAAASEYLIFERITSHDLQIPSTIAPAAQDLLRQLLDSDPSKRIGARGRGLSELKEHPFFAGTAWQSLRKQKAPAAVHEESRKDDSVDWEWSSLAAALPVYSSPDGALADVDNTSQRTSRDEQQHESVPQQHLAQNLIGPAAAAAQHTKSALTGLLCQSTASHVETSNSTAKISWQDKPEERASSERSRPPQQGLSSGTAKSAAGTGQGASPAVNKSCASAGVPSSPQHRAQAGRVTPAQERAAVVSPIACSTDKASGAPLSPKHDGHKPPASAAHAVPHHKSGSSRIPMRAPSRKGDFLSQSPGQAAYAGSSGRDDRADQAAAIMMLNQLVADAHAYGAN